MTVVVTGAAGHLGANLVRALLDAGQSVRATVYQDRRALDGLDVEVVPADTSAPDSLVAAFDGAEVVYNLAARITIVGGLNGVAQKANVQGTQNVVDACLKTNVRRLVHFSSIQAFRQEPIGRPLDETRPNVDLQTAFAYDRSKAMGEAVVHAGIKKGQDAVIVNPTAVVGPYDFKPSRMGQVLIDLATHKLPGLVAGGFDWVDSRDVVAGAMAAAQKGRTGERYLLGGRYQTVAELAAMVADLTNVPAPWFVCPMGLAKVGAPFAEAFAKLTGKEPRFTTEGLAALCGNRKIVTDKAENELGYTKRPLADTLADTLSWFESQGKVKPE